jgi:hypothetical protein
MEISKEKLLSLLKLNLQEMAMDFETNDRPDRQIQAKLAQGETPIKKVPLPQSDNPNQNYQELLASERYKEVIERMRQYTGVNTPVNGEGGSVPQLQGMMMQAFMGIVRTEQAHREELAQLAIEVITKEMGIPEGAFQYDVKIVDYGNTQELGTGDFKRDENGEENRPQQDAPNIENNDEEEDGDVENDYNEGRDEIEEELFVELESLNLEKAKRRVINAMMQGAAQKGYYMYHYVEDRLREITGSDQLINQYGIMMSVNDTMYWQYSPQTMKMAMGGDGEDGSVAGKEKVERTDPPTIKVRGVSFPVLLHELIKGIMEVNAVNGRPDNEEEWEKVEQSEDTLEKEIWDLRLGPSIWNRIRSQFPESILTDETKVELQNFLLTAIFSLPAKNFLVFIKEVIGKTPAGKHLMDELFMGVEQSLSNQEYQDAMNNFQDSLNNISDNTDDDDLNNMLGDLGIRFS